MFDKIDTLMKNFKLILRSLLSNDACVVGGRSRPWYLAVPIFFIAMILALVPIFVQTITRQGDSIVSENSYEMDVASEHFLKAADEAGIVMKVENKKLVVDEEKWNETFTTKDESGNNCYIHVHPTDSTGVNDLGVYYIPNVKLTETLYQSIVQFPSTDKDGNPVKVNRTYSFILLTENRVTVYVYSINKSGGTSIGTIYGDFESFEDGYTINSILAENTAKTWENWKSFYRIAYNNNRIKLTWQTTLIMLGINAGITVFMGLMLWVLTRGKNNLNWFGLWETQKIAAWSTLTPAILTTGLGFLLASFSQVMFPMLLGVRVMWLSMKLLRPENASMYPPLKEKSKVVDVKPVK